MTLMIQGETENIQKKKRERQTEKVQADITARVSGKGLKKRHTHFQNLK